MFTNIDANNAELAIFNSANERVFSDTGKKYFLAGTFSIRGLDTLPAGQYRVELIWGALDLGEDGYKEFNIVEGRHSKDSAQDNGDPQTPPGDPQTPPGTPQTPPDTQQTPQTTPQVQSKPISEATVPSIADKQYTGKQIQPSVTVKAGAATLRPGTDYTVKYGANKNIGKGTVVITGAGDYTGAETVAFNIVPKKTSISKITVGAKQAKITWKKVSSAQKVTKYQVGYRVKGVSKWTTKTVSAGSSSYTIQKLKKGKAYQFQVRSYKTVGGVNYSSPWSAVKTSKKVK
jgi:hypothetical protein